MSRITYADGAVQQRHFDLNYRPLGLEGAGGDFVFEPDELGNIISISAVSDGEERRYLYDALGRLEEVSDGLGALLSSYGYDETGNRLSRTHNGFTELYGYAAESHQLRSINGRSRQHDPAGNLSSFDGLVFNHDTRSRLEGALRMRPRTSIRNSYNGFGQRVRKTGTYGERLFAYNLAGQLIGEYDAAGHPIQEFIWMDNLPVGVMVQRAGDYSGQVMAIYSDHLGTPRAVAGQNGELLWRWSLVGEPFGDHQPNEDANDDGVPFVLNLRFPGQYYDPETGLYYNYFRDYDPAVGRYVQSDPIGLAGGGSTYAYVHGSPISLTDPFGLFDVYAVRYGSFHAENSGSDYGYKVKFYQFPKNVGRELGYRLMSVPSSVKPLARLARWLETIGGDHVGVSDQDWSVRRECDAADARAAAIYKNRYGDKRHLTETQLREFLQAVGDEFPSLREVYDADRIIRAAQAGARY